MKKNLISKVIGVILVTGMALPLSAQNKINVDASKVQNNISPYLYASGIEDVNHEIYGGLYDQRIFGESFEEPTPNVQLQNFSEYDGSWVLNGNILHVNGWDGAKQVYNQTSMNDGIIELDIKFDRSGANDCNAGILARVSSPGKGADAFNGYEISLTNDGKKVILGRHRWNWTELAKTNVNINPTEWNTLKVEITGSKIKISLNDELVLNYTDLDPITGISKAAIRTWRSDVSFRNFTITPSGSEKQDIAFVGKDLIEVSKMWDAITTGNAAATFKHIDDDAYNAQYSQELEFVSGTGTVGIANRSLNKWGIAVRENQTFTGLLLLKGTITGKIKVALQNVDGTQEYAVQEINTITDNWAKYTFDLTSNTTDKNARFAIYMDKPGKIRVDQVSLMSTGEDQFHGLACRKDIGQAMLDQGLTFLRYGGTMVNVPGYKFKDMIGPREDRPMYTGHYYRYASNGFGIEDFLQYCEAAGFEPSFAVNVEESAQDMADMIEYLKGDITTEWGAKRAANGYPEPYNLTYLEIGNEEVIWADSREDYQRYIDQFNKIYDAIHPIDKDIRFVHSAWWRPESESNMKMVFDALNGKAEYWDYHPWADELNSGKDVERELKEMQAFFKKWDPNTTMKCALFEENGNTHNLQRALAHATIQNAARRMGDFVLATCAANALEPYKQNDNGWNQGQVFFTPSQVWGMPPYYAQQMAANNHKPIRIASETPRTLLDVVAATDDEKKEIVLYVVNTGNTAISAEVNISNAGKLIEAKTYTLTGALSDVNTPENPTKIIPIETSIEVKEIITNNFPANSYTVMVLKFDKESGTKSKKKTVEKCIITSGEKQISFKSDSTESINYEIISMVGNCVVKGSLKPKAQKTEICDAGTYLVSLHSESDISVSKLIVQ